MTKQDETAFRDALMEPPVKRVMPELVIKQVAGMDVITGFTGTIIKRSVPGVNIHHDARQIFRTASPGGPATVAHVSRIDDPDIWYEANVTRMNAKQSFVAVRISKGVPDVRFPPGTRVFVRRA